MANMSVNGIDEQPSSDVDLRLEAQSDDDGPIVVKFEEVSAAAFKIRGSVERTPCNVSSTVM